MDFIQISISHNSTCKLNHKKCHQISYHSDFFLGFSNNLEESASLEP